MTKEENKSVDKKDEKKDEKVYTDPTILNNEYKFGGGGGKNEEK